MVTADLFCRFSNMISARLRCRLNARGSKTKESTKPRPYKERQDGIGESSGMIVPQKIAGFRGSAAGSDRRGSDRLQPMCRVWSKHSETAESLGFSSTLLLSTGKCPYTYLTMLAIRHKKSPGTDRCQGSVRSAIGSARLRLPGLSQHLPIDSL